MAFRRWLVLPFAFLLLVSACNDGSEEDADRVIRFGAALSLTGDLANEGRLVKDGYDFMVDLINEEGGIPVGDEMYRVEIKYYDDESDADTAVRLYEKLITQDGVDFLLGPYSSGVTLPASTVAERHKVPMVVAHAAAADIYERGYQFVFATLNSVDQYTINILRMATEQSPPAETVALIAENALFPVAGIDGAEQQAEDLGLEVVYKETYTTGTTDFSPLLTQVRDLEPDVLIMGGYTGDLITVTRQMDEVGVEVKMAGFLLGPTVPGFIEDLGELAEGLLEPIQWASNMTWEDETFGLSAAEFAEQFEAEFGYAPDYHPPQSSAALEVYYDAIGRAGSLEPQAVRDAIAETDLMTFYGPIQFNEKGQNVAKSMGVIQVQDQTPVVVYPEEFAQAELIYPMP